MGAAPSAQVRYQSDQLGSNLGMEEWEATLNLPITPPGERGARMAAARQQAHVQKAEIDAMWLQVAGEVREAVWSVRLAQVDVDHARIAYDYAAELERSVRRRVEEGELPSNDLAVVRADLLAREIDHIDAQAEHDHTLRRYKVLTGLSDLPTDMVELAEEDAHELTPEHPFLVLMDARRNSAGAETNLARRYWATKPSVGFGMRSERSFANAPHVRAGGVQFSVPLDFGAFNSEQTSQAMRQQARAERDFLDMERQLGMALHDTEQVLDMARRAEQVAVERDQIAQRTLASARRAYDMGESDLMNYLNVQARARQAALMRARREIEVLQAIARLNQAMGHLPQ